LRLQFWDQHAKVLIFLDYEDPIGFVKNELTTTWEAA